jgi:glycosyltransferase involved in cell wall biosynthesis
MRMARRKVLMLTYHFPPSAGAGVFRILGFAEHLPSYGWECVVVAPHRLPWEPAGEALLQRIPSGTAVFRISYPNHWFWKPLRKVYPWGAWLPFAAIRAYQAIRDHHPDLLLTSGPPHVIHLLGRQVHRWSGLPWIADFRDPWVAGDPSLTSPHPAGWEVRAERRVIGEADAIIANTPSACELLCRAYPGYAGKMTSITNGYDPGEFEANPIRPFSRPTIDVIHTGTIYANRSPNPFLDAIQGLGPEVLAGKSLRVRFVGGLIHPEQRHDIEAKIREVDSARVLLEDHIPHAESIRAMVQSDLLLLLDTPGRRAGVPAKLYEYIGAGRPILALADPEGDVAWVLKESGAPHRVAPPLDSEAIKRAMIELLRDPLTSRPGARSGPSDSRFTRKRLAGEFAAQLDSCARLAPSKARVRSFAEAAR